MLASGTLTLRDENGNELNMDLSTMQLLTIIRVLGLKDTTGNAADNQITCFGDKGLFNINYQLLDKHKYIFGEYKYPIPMDWIFGDENDKDPPKDTKDKGKKRND